MVRQVSGALVRAWYGFWRTLWLGVQAKQALRNRRISTCTAFMENLLTHRREQ